MKILAQNSIGEGLLPMKEGGQKEANKSELQQNTELCNFIKNAFVVNGDVKLVYGEEIKTKTYFIAEDDTRGKFAVFFMNLKE